MGNSCFSGETQDFCFGPFVLTPGGQLLVNQTTPVRIGARSLEILTALVQRPGEVVSKEDLVCRAWPDTFVEESNLKVNVAALRRALGDNQESPRYIATVKGRGYRFIAPVECSSPQAQQASVAALEPPRLPVLTTRIIGRAGVVEMLSSRVLGRRLLTITGPGGIGKTTVAAAVAEELRGAFEHGVRFIDLTGTRHVDQVWNALVAALGLSLAEADPAAEVCSFFGSRRLLIVLDGCERAIDGAAEVADRLTRHLSNVHILATSREPLRARDEHVYAMPGLECPIEFRGVAAGEALQSPAVELFAESAAAASGYCLTDEDVPFVTEICRRLDGVPLAIELAAAGLDSLVPSELLGLLDDCLILLNRGKRTAPRRHQSLRATLDWSYDLLSDPERLLFHRVSVFPGTFVLESACAVATDRMTSRASVVEALSGLVAKSLIVADLHASVTRYRLYEGARAYARLKLHESGEEDVCLRRHIDNQASMLRRNAFATGFAPSGERRLSVVPRASRVSSSWIEVNTIEGQDGSAAGATAPRAGQEALSEEEGILAYSETLPVQSDSANPALRTGGQSELSARPRALAAKA